MIYGISINHLIKIDTNSRVHIVAIATIRKFELISAALTSGLCRSRVVAVGKKVLITFTSELNPAATIVCHNNSPLR